jgi:ribosome-associated toxin RatA of RatAB toxin-antitoxin module
MVQVQKTVLVPHSSEEMFLLVDDVNRYTEFLPWCGGVEVIKQDENATIATIHIDYHGLHQHFTTENTKTRPHLMSMRLKQGPFKKFEGTWKFTNLSEVACKIEFVLHYEFSSSILEKIIAPVFNHIANTFVDNFVARAETIYKKG